MIKRTVMTVLLSAVTLVAAASLAGLASASGHDGDDGETVRIMARLRSNDSIEFGIRSSAGPQIPRLRFLSASVNDGAWKRSSPIELPNGTVVKIIVRRAEGERAEFGLRIEDPLQQFLPPKRYFPRNATVDKWLFSTPMLIPAPEQAGEADEPAPPPEPETTPTPEEEPSTPDESDGEESSDEGASVERISGGHRDGLIVEGNIVGDPDAPVLIVEYGDPF
ncbi:MAG: hypothetical protein OXD50_05880 [Chloroflexi bacterium]|nr:hypothetical protein [Chloroflexota bacterium]